MKSGSGNKSKKFLKQALNINLNKVHHDSERISLEFNNVLPDEKQYFVKKKVEIHHKTRKISLKDDKSEPEV